MSESLSCTSAKSHCHVEYRQGLISGTVFKLIITALLGSYFVDVVCLLFKIKNEQAQACSAMLCFQIMLLNIFQINFQIKTWPSWQINIFQWEYIYLSYILFCCCHETREAGYFTPVLEPQEISTWPWWGPQGGWLHSHWIMCKRGEWHVLEWPRVMRWDRRDEGGTSPSFVKQSPGIYFPIRYVSAFINRSPRGSHILHQIPFLKIPLFDATSVRDHASCRWAAFVSFGF